MSTKYKLVVQQRADLLNRARRILEGADGGNRTLTNAETANHADIMGQVKKLNRDLEVEEAGIAAERQMEPVVDVNAPTRAQADILHPNGANREDSKNRASREEARAPHRSEQRTSIFGRFFSAQTAKTRKIELVAKKLGLLTEASNELLSSGVSFRDQLEETITRALGWFLDDAFLNGTGAGQPLGVLNDPALIAVPKQGGQAADTIQYENVVDMFARLHPALVEDAVFVVNPTTIPQLLTMSLVIGTGGTHIPVMTEAGNGFRMLGRDVLLTEKLPTLGDEGDILLAAFSQYAVGLRAEMSLDRSQHVGFARDVETYRGILRGDGQGKWSGAYTPKTGSTLSWAVTLAART